MTYLPPNAIAVGIDLGTTYSVVALVDAHGQPQIIPNSDNERTTPSVVYFQSGMAIVGKIAKEQTQMGDADAVQFVKSYIGRARKRFMLGGEEWSPEEISAIILKKLIKDAELAMPDKKITHAVITVPAFFTEQQRKSTEDAGRIAGLEVMGIINEPTAAALAYGFDTLGVDRKVVVYDLGGGTFDVTVMDISGETVTMLATDGDVQLGGKDWDEKIIEFISEQFEEKYNINPMDDIEVHMQLQAVAEQAKLRLSKLPVTRVSVTCQGITGNFEITREQFEELTEDLLSQTETTLILTVREAGLTFDQVDEILLVGGSTRMLAVRRMLQRIFKREPRQILNPDECVAQGAAIHAVMMQLKLAALGQDVPLPNVSENQLERFRVMQEQLINAHTMGILALNGTGQQVVVPIIPRRTHIPRREIKTFRTSIDSQQQIRINVKEGENVNPEACADLGTCLVRGLPDGLAKGTPIEVCFECTHDGRLEVTARLPTIQQVVQTQIARTLGMSDEAIEDSRLRINEVRIE